MNDYTKEMKIIENIEAQLAVLKSMLNVSEQTEELFDFDTTLTIDKMPAVDNTDMSFVVGKDAYGKDYSISLKNVSNIGIVGDVATGKTNFMRLVLSALANNDNVEIDVIEPYGDREFNDLSRSINTHIVGSDVEALKEIDDYLKEFEEEMNYRLENIYKLTNDSNFWNVPVSVREEADLKLIVLAINEITQLVFKSNSGVSREVMKLKKSIISTLENIVSKGKSVGVVVIWDCQTLSDDNGLAGVIHNTDIKVAFKMTSPYNVKKFYGVEVPLNQPSPLEITREQRGTAVVMDDYNKFEKVKINYID